MILLIWIIALTAAVVLYFRQVYSYFSSREIKTMKVIAPFGNMARAIFRLEHFTYDLDKLYHAYPEERFIGRYEFTKPIVILRDLELIKKIGVKDFEYFLDHRGFTDAAVEPLFARSLFALRGQEWKDMRSTLSPAFTSSKIRQMLPFMEEVGAEMIRALKNNIKESKDGYIELDCKDLTSRYANDVIASCAFGLKVDSHTDRDNQFYEMGKNAATFKFKQMLMFFANAAFPNVAKRLKLKLFSQESRNFFLDLVLNTMSERELRHIIRNDMIHLLMEAKKGRLTYEEKSLSNGARDTGFATVEESAVGKKSHERVWSDIDLVAQAVLFFIAGFETISSAMSFALHELAVNPDVQERLAKEIIEHDNKHGGKLDYSSIQNMVYMDMVVSETLRLWPPGVALDRECVKEYNLGKPNKNSTKDYILKVGEVVNIPVYSIHRDPEYYPNPDKFDPERFSDENKHLINPITYLPFGIGPRNCIGSRFALCELKVLIYQILRHMELSPSEKTRLPARLATDTFNIRLDGGHWLRFKSRS